MGAFFEKIFYLVILTLGKIGAGLLLGSGGIWHIGYIQVPDDIRLLGTHMIFEVFFIVQCHFPGGRLFYDQFDKARFILLI